jgi:hypothetical protein
MGGFGDLLDVALEETQGVGVGEHDGGDDVSAPSPAPRRFAHAAHDLSR